MSLFTSFGRVFQKASTSLDQKIAERQSFQTPRPRQPEPEVKLTQEQAYEVAISTRFDEMREQRHNVYSETKTGKVDPGNFHHNLDSY